MNRFRLLKLNPKICVYGLVKSKRFACVQESQYQTADAL